MKTQDNLRQNQYVTSKEEDIPQVLPLDPSSSGKNTSPSKERSEEGGEPVEMVDSGVLHSRQMRERRKIVLWRRPLSTLFYFMLESRIEATKVITR